jgi:DNA-binding CsgD family transcriptional regulator
VPGSEGVPRTGRGERRDVGSSRGREVNDRQDEIVRRWASGETGISIGRSFGISRQRISQIVARVDNLVRVARPRPSPTARFDSKIRKSDGCWEWTASRYPTGYGHFRAPGTSNGYAHRFAWEDANGPIPAGLHVCHHCDNPICVRPDHLFLGTPLDNMRDRDAKGRGRLPPQNTQSMCRRGLHEMAVSAIYWGTERRCGPCYQAALLRRAK